MRVLSIFGRRARFGPRDLLLPLTVSNPSVSCSRGEDVFVQIPVAMTATYEVCECCGKADISKENMTEIESGQLLCPACLKAFREALQLV